MKINKFFITASVFSGLFAFAGLTSAADYVPITGISYGTKIGLIHFQPDTAVNPSPSTLIDSKYFKGPSKEFYISQYDDYYLDTAHPYTPKYESIATRISTDTGDCTGGNCLLKGFAWSNKIGWISFDGQIISNAIIDNGGSAMPSNYYPKISTNTAPSTKRVPVTGFAWNEYTGWIRLSYDLTSGSTVDTDSQQASANCSGTCNWGVWLDGGMDSDTIDITDPDLNIPKLQKLGRHINGFAWSEKLGWIKFSNSSADGATPDVAFTTYTLWIPDSTPPVPLIPDKLWFAAGVNTHYPDVTIKPENIAWDEFAMDPESGINEKETKIFLQRTGGGSSCIAPDTSGIGRMIYDMPSSPYNYNALGVGDMLRLILPGLAKVPSPDNGFCKYELSAEIWNDVNSITYVGDHFLPGGTCPAGKKCFDSSSVYVRAGDYSENRSSVNVVTNPASSDPTNPSVLADGKETAQYTADFLDVAGNPVVDINCAASGNSGYEYDNCPGREVAVLANITNELKFDLTQPLVSQNIRPVKYRDVPGSPSSLFLTEDDGSLPADSAERVIDGTSVLSWPVRNHTASDTWDIEINKSGFQYPVTFTSYSPSSSGSTCCTLPLQPTCSSSCFYQSNSQDLVSRIFQVNSFYYKVYNEKLPETSKQFSGYISESPFNPGYKTENTATQVAACYDDSDPDSASHPKCANITFPTTPSGNRVTSEGVIVSTAPQMLTFRAPIVTGNASLSGEVAGGGLLTLSSPTDITFAIKNLSTRDFLASADPALSSGFSLDNVFQYYGTTAAGSSAAALMETQRISNETSGDDKDGYMAWTDPYEFCPACTRYEMYMKGGYNYSSPSMTPLAPANTPFVNFFSQYHPSSLFYYSDDANNGSNTILSSEVNTKLPSNILNQLPSEYKTDQIDSEGRYWVTGLASIPNQFPPIVSAESGGDITDPVNYNPGYVDSNDPVKADMTAGASINKTIRFYPEKLIPVTINDLKLRLVHEIAYRFPEQPIYTKYADEKPLMENVDVKDTGLEAKGTVAGQQIVTNRQFDVIGTASTQKLQEQMRRNVSELTAGISPCVLSGSQTTVASLPVTGSCINEDDVNGSLTAYYQGNSGQTLVLDSGNPDFIIPDKPYSKAEPIFTLKITLSIRLREHRHSELYLSRLI